jgi:carboxyl-terminal processing protease
MRCQLPFALLASVFLAAFPGRSEIEQAVLTTKPLYSDIARTLAYSLPRHHISHLQVGDEAAERAFKDYFDALDFDHTVFMAEDIAKYEADKLSWDDNLKQGDIRVAFEIFELYKQRLRDRVAFVNGLLEEGFDLEKKETYIWKRKDQPWPAGQDAWDDLWRKKAKHEYLGRLVSKEMEAQKAAKEEAEKAEKEKTSKDETAESPAPSKEEAPDNTAASQEGDAAKDKNDEKPFKTTRQRIMDLPADEFMRRRYEQLLTVIEGHDADYVMGLYLNSFAKAYDVHTNYMAPRNSEDFDIQMSLSLQGIGAVLSTQDGAAEIEKLMPGGPAQKDGRLKPGDRIVAVAQEGEEPVDIMFWPLYRSVRLIRGPKGSQVTLHVIPVADRTGSKINEITLVRDEIKLEERAAKSLTRETSDPKTKEDFKVGVVTLPDFYADMKGRRMNDPEARSCAVDIRREVEKMKKQGVDGIILDLRNNGGGSLPDCVVMSGLFFESGPVVQVRQAPGKTGQPYPDPDPSMLYDGPMVILVNRHSASASEILAAALQDYGRAVVVGDQKTHGKGTVQTLLPLDRRSPELGQIKVTTAKFYRIDGRSTQLMGVSPDIVIPSPLDVLEVGEEHLGNVLEWDMVSPARFEKFGNLTEIVKELVVRSDERRKQDARFAARDDLIERVKERAESIEISLNREDRMLRAKQDEELSELQEKLFAIAGEEDDEEEESTDKEDKEENEDLVLEEGIHILRDLIQMMADQEVIRNI